MTKKLDAIGGAGCKVNLETLHSSWPSIAGAAPDAFDKGWADGYQASERNHTAAGMKAASAMLCVTRQEMRLACGEMTAQEMRTVLAVLEWRRAAIVKKAEAL